jgi:alpha-1,2-mannosyltransferase
MITIARNPGLAGRDGFMTNLLAMHGLLLVPLFISSRPHAAAERNGFSSVEYLGYALLAGSAAIVHKLNLDAFTAILGKSRPLATLHRTILSHPAQSSISFDVIWVFITLVCWYFTVGSWKILAFKAVVLGAATFGGWVSYTGVNWPLVASIVPIGGLASVGIIIFALGRLKARNEKRRKAFMEKIGVIEENVIPGTDKTPPSFAPRRLLVGFWHPYW